MKMRTALCGLLVPLLISIATTGTWSDMLTREQANEEVQLVHDTVMAMHPDPFWFYTEAEWAAHMDMVLSRKGPVGPVEQYYTLAGIMSLATDTHTQLYPIVGADGFTTSFPIRFRLYEEGIYITAADGYLADTVGTRLISVSGVAAKDVALQLSRFASADHPVRKLQWGVEYLMPIPGSYEYLGWMKDGAVTLELETRDGERRTVIMEETIDQGFAEVMNSGRATAYYWPEGWRTLDDLIPGDVPMSRASLQDNYWYTDLEDGKAVYVQVNTPVNKEGGESLNAFILRVFQDIDAREVTPEKLILDLRYDLGGQIDLSLPLAYLAASSKICCKPGNIVTLIGRETISAGSLTAGAMEIAPRGIMIGEVTGSKPGLFLGHIGFDLPYSQFEPEAPRVFFTTTDRSDNRLWVAPDIPIAESFEAIMTGRDFPLQAALALTYDDARGFYPLRNIVTPWLRPSQEGAHHERPEE